MVVARGVEAEWGGVGVVVVAAVSVSAFTLPRAGGKRRGEVMVESGEGGEEEVGEEEEEVTLMVEYKDDVVGLCVVVVAAGGRNKSDPTLLL